MNLLQLVSVGEEKLVLLKQFDNFIFMGFYLKKRFDIVLLYTVFDLLNVIEPPLIR